MLPTTSAPAATAAVASPPAAASKLRYVMPPFGKGVSIQMTSWIPGDAEQARAVVADKNYELAFLYSEYKGGKDQQWTKYATAVMQREIASVLLAPDVTTESFTGTIRYFKMRVIPDPTVPGRLDVSSCFDNAKSSNTSLKTGAVLPDTGTASQHYVRITDQLAKGAAGEWQVAASLQPVYYPQAKECKP
jgi:ketosteroid isomerase-like protein